MKYTRWRLMMIGTLVLGFQATVLGWITTSEVVLACTESSSVDISVRSDDSKGTVSITDQLPNELFQGWRHSFEDDTEDTTVYRPVDYDFPPARGRAGIEFLAYGGFIDWIVAPTDALQSVHGFWRIEDERIHLSFENNISEPQIIEIVEYSADILKIRRFPICEEATLTTANNLEGQP